MKSLVKFFITILCSMSSGLSLAHTYFNCQLDLHSASEDGSQTYVHTPALKSFLQKEGARKTASFDVNIEDIDLTVKSNLYQWTSMQMWLTVDSKVYRFNAYRSGSISFPIEGTVKLETLRKWGNQTAKEDVVVSALELWCTITDKAKYPNHLEIVE